jgi:hypothetical protein
MPVERIPDDQEGKSSPLHRLFILTGWLSKVTPAQLLPTWAALVLVAAWPWEGQRWLTGTIFLASFLIDWVALALLPVFRRSWGPVSPPLLALAIVRTGFSWLIAQILPGGDTGIAVLGGVNLVINAIVIYATWVEPFRVELTKESLRLPGWSTEHPLRLLHISDLHFEDSSPRERAVLEQIHDLQPDLIVLTGDYMNLSSVYDAEAQAGARAFLAQLDAPLGVYAVTGSPVVDVAGIVPEVFRELPIHWLDDEAVRLSWNENEFQIVGIRCTRSLDRDIRALKELIPPSTNPTPTLLLYHTPDLMPDVEHTDIDLYLAGHTHGGQLRLPVYGALFTSSRWGKRYEMGRYEAKGTTLYVSRGLGLEGLGAPRARFLAPPEIILWTLTG